MVLASTQRSLGLVIAAVVFVGFVAAVFINMRRARPELGNEIELAPNRKPYFTDDELEGPKLDRSLSFALVLLIITGVALPLYWLAEPGRQAGAVAEFDRIFERRGEQLFASTAEGGLGCAGCHGAAGAGGVAPHILTDANAQFVAEVTWKAPALNTAYLRFDREEIRWILDYGRPFSPMQAWGADGGGPLTTQQIDYLLDYIESFQLTPEEAQAEVAAQLDKMMTTDRIDLTDPDCQEGGREDPDCEILPAYDDLGEAVFNLGLEDGFAGGAYACGRCHTPGWSYGRPGKAGDGAYGPSLIGVEAHFGDAEQQARFVSEGSVEGQTYGSQGQGKGGGQMPGYGEVFTEEQIAAVIEYERGLSGAAGSGS